MITVIIETADSEAQLARTLASLVPGAVEGVVREVIVLDRGSKDATFKVAEHAGCRWLGDGDLSAAIGTAKAEWLMFVPPGARLVAGWMEPVAAHTARATGPARLSAARGTRIPLMRRVFPMKAAAEHGVIVTKRQAAALCRPGYRVHDLTRGLAMRQLRAEILPAESEG
jgi:hypothetical protein